MLEIEVQDIVRKEAANVPFFHDDSIEVIRQRISDVADIHPDRLFCMIRIQHPNSYYRDDPRRWEALFYRLSYRTKSILRPVFHAYQTDYRSPPTNVDFTQFDLEEWMSYPSALQAIHSPESGFSELYILGVDEPLSYILPLDYDSSLTNQIPQTMLPVPQRSALLSTLYTDETKIKGLKFKAYDSSAAEVQSVYFPFLTSESPQRLTPDTISLLKKVSDRLDALLAISQIPEPEQLTILRTRFYIPFVNTDLGEAIRTRFEQMFFGLTVSKDTPYIGLLTSSGETMRHKFFVEDEKNKESYLNMEWWNSWWTKTRPARNRSTLLLYRGKSQTSFDRIAITSGDIVVSTYRPEGNKDELEDLRKGAHKWLESLDSIMPFLKKEDTDLTRWELQDMNILATYKKKLDQVDLRRSDCVSFLYDMSDAKSSTFRLLRTDQSVQGLSAMEVKVLQLLKDQPLLTDVNIQKELDVPIEIARKLIRSVRNKEQEDPSIMSKSFRGLPTMQFGEHTILISSVHTLKLPVEYASLLRYILSDPTAKVLEDLCPKRVETGRVETGVPPPQKVEEDDALMAEYEDMFDYVGEGEDEAPPEEPMQEDEEEEAPVFDIKQKSSTTKSYFLNRLKKFDPELFNDPEYPTKCEQSNQPVALSPEDLERLSSTPYDPRKYTEPGRILELNDPERSMGIAICPEFWCIRDEIPLQESDLINEGGIQKCPECKGQIKEKDSNTSSKFTVIRRDKSYLIPRWTKYKSEKTGKPLPCCFMKEKSERPDNKRESDSKYYILSERKRLDPLSVSFLPAEIVRSLHIKQLYDEDAKKDILEGKRVAGGIWGFFRVGLGRPIKNLPIFFFEKAKERPAIPRPSESIGIDITLKCSFFHTWTKKSDKHVTSITNDLANKGLSEQLAPLISGVDHAFENGELTQLQELEYACIFLKCDVFRLNMNTNKVGWLFQSPVSAPRSRAILTLEIDNRIDLLSFVTREGSVNAKTGYRTGSPDMIFKADLLHKYFSQKTETYPELEKIRNSLRTEIPNYAIASRIVDKLKGTDTPQLIQDPYGRVQAFYIPEKLILPFRPSAVPIDPPVMKYGYSDDIDLPNYYVMRENLKIAEADHPGYKWKEDLANIDGERAEIVLQSGLRIPTEPDTDKGEDIELGEVAQTIQETDETNLVFGEPDNELKQFYSDISYASEVFDFLLFELSEDLKENEPGLKEVLRPSQPNKEAVMAPLQRWFNKTTRFVDIKSAEKFVTKVRKACGQFSKNQCSGNVCGWDSSSNKCKVEVKQSLGETKMFNRLLTTLVTNAKLRGMVLDGRSTPFFSTILYIELPHELILTDSELQNLL
jgi:hypothetical protein